MGRSEFLRHKDKVQGHCLQHPSAVSAAHPPSLVLNSLFACVQEVRLYTALCICHVLRLNAPDSPFSEEQLQVGSNAVVQTGLWVLHAVPNGRCRPACCLVL